jgi:hypothetical protein
MGYKSEETLGNLKGSERINEDKSFGDIWKKTKTILSENVNELTDKRKDESEMGECGTGMYEDSLYETNGQNTVRDVEKLDILFDKIGSIKAALDKIDTRAEVIQAVNLFVSGLFEKHPELASATKNQLIQTVRDTVDTAIDTSRQPQAEPSMAQMEEGSIYETDRFNEVFGTDEVSSDFAKSNFHFDEEREIFNELNQNFFYDPETNKVYFHDGAPYRSSFDLVSDILGPKYSYEEKREVYDRVMEKWKESEKRFR